MLLVPNKANSRISGSYPLFGGFGGSRWSPASLFKNGEQGWLMDLSLASLFQDAAGTTPVTEPGQPVGLVLDKSQGGALGPELIPADYTTVFNASATGLSVETSALVATSATAVQYGWSGSAFANGSLFQVEFLVSDLSLEGGASLNLRFGNAGSNDANITSNGAYRFVLDGEGGGFTFRAGGALGGIASWRVTNISVREIPGNHASQATALNRPIYGREPKGGRRNLLLSSDKKTLAYSVNVVRTDAVGVFPQNITEGWELTATADMGAHQTGPTDSVSGGTGGTETVSVFVKASGYSKIRMYLANQEGGYAATFDLTTGEATNNGAVSFGIENVGDGWFRCSFSFISTKANPYPSIRILDNSGESSFSGDGVKGVMACGFQWETGSTVTPYQRVTTAFDVTEAGVPSVNYLSFNGTNQWMQTAAFDWGSDEATVCVGLHKASDSSTQAALEFSPIITNNEGSFLLFAATGSYNWRSKGSLPATGSNATATSYAAPVSSVVTGEGVISGDLSRIRVDGAVKQTNATDQGTGNYQSYPLYIGARGGSAQFLNGNLYSLFGINRLLSGSELASAEDWVAKRTGGLTP